MWPLCSQQQSACEWRRHLTDTGGQRVPVLTVRGSTSNVTALQRSTSRRSLWPHSCKLLLFPQQRLHRDMSHGETAQLNSSSSYLRISAIRAPAFLFVVLHSSSREHPIGPQLVDLDWTGLSTRFSNTISELDLAVCYTKQVEWPWNEYKYRNTFLFIEFKTYMGWVLSGKNRKRISLRMKQPQGFSYRKCGSSYLNSPWSVLFFIPTEWTVTSTSLQPHVHLLLSLFKDQMKWATWNLSSLNDGSSLHTSSIHSSATIIIRSSSVSAHEWFHFGVWINSSSSGPSRSLVAVKLHW